MHSTAGAVAGGGSRRRGISMRCVAADELACDLEMARNAQPGVAPRHTEAEHLGRAAMQYLGSPATMPSYKTLSLSRATAQPDMRGSLIRGCLSRARDH